MNSNDWFEDFDVLEAVCFNWVWLVILEVKERGVFQTQTCLQVYKIRKFYWIRVFVLVAIGVPCHNYWVDSSIKWGISLSFYLFAWKTDKFDIVKHGNCIMPKIMIELTWMMQLRRVKTLQIDWDN